MMKVSACSMKFPQWRNSNKILKTGNNRQLHTKLRYSPKYEISNKQFPPQRCCPWQLPGIRSIPQQLQLFFWFPQQIVTLHTLFQCAMNKKSEQMSETNTELQTSFQLTGECEQVSPLGRLSVIVSLNEYQQLWSPVLHMWRSFFQLQQGKPCSRHRQTSNTIAPLLLSSDSSHQRTSFYDALMISVSTILVVQAEKSRTMTIAICRVQSQSP